MSLLQIVKLEREAKVAMAEKRYSPHSIWTCVGSDGGGGGGGQV